MFGSFKRSLVPLLGPLLGGSAVLCLPVSAGAIKQPRHLQGHAELELAGPTVALRTMRVGNWMAPRAGQRGRNFARLEAELGPRMLARFDAETGVLDTLIPAGFAVPGASRSPAVAEQFALDFLTRHIDLLAPGSLAADFQLVSNTTSNGVRSVGFIQTHAGRKVIGGQLSLRFKADQLIAVRSQAFASVTLPGGPSSSSVRADASTIEARAQTWLARDYANNRRDLVRPSSAIEGPMILPLIRPGGVVDYREVVAIEIEVDAPIGRWQVYVDTRSGEPVARRSLLRWAELEYTAWQRSPVGPRSTFPAAYVEATVDGELSPTDAGGQLLISGLGTAASFGTDGLYLRVLNDAGPVSSIATLLDPAQIFTWDLGENPEQDAQINAYIHGQRVKDYVRGLDPEFAPLDLETAVTVNIDSACNAFADGNTLNFFLAGDGCQNTGLIADIVYHEYGHVVHVLGLVPGVGLFNGAHSEGASDYLSATIVDDSSVGKGFFIESGAPIRELDPDGYEWHWPEDIGEVHNEGRIIGGTLWDLRERLIEKYGEAQGVAKTDQIWLDGIRRAVDIPSTYLEALITNDDDGNLQNGTPDICEINQVFAAHGLYDPPGKPTEVTTETRADGSIEVRLSFGLPFAGCPGVTQPTGLLRFRPRPAPGEDAAPATELFMTPVGSGLLGAVIPPQTQFSVTQYQVELDWGNGTTAARPNNFGDPWYESFNGEPTPIWCTDFEGEPGADGWALGGEWDWGLAEGGSGDPNGGFAGAAIGTNLVWPGSYPPNTHSTLTRAGIDVSGFEHVRLQYQRWLTVEDGYWDQATISANGEVVWANFNSNNDILANTHHRDREWRFHDVDLTEQVGADGQLSLSFGLISDGGLEFGGWNVDQLCIVGHGESSGGDGGCGDGFVQQYEDCDDGNLDNGDGCSSGCLLESDDGDEPIVEAELGWDPDGRGCGCTSGDPSNPHGARGGWLLLGLLGLWGGIRRSCERQREHRFTPTQPRKPSEKTEQ